ncbi:MAG: hypothetical protein IPJ82_20690 [Lewinellaceae bacterium]|nr:hypothetical protein [Lewinellaceae bacterium]
METRKFITKEELYTRLGLSKSTFYRLVKKRGIVLPPGLLSPEDQDWLCKAIGAGTSNHTPPPPN